MPSSPSGVKTTPSGAAATAATMRASCVYAGGGADAGLARATAAGIISVIDAIGAAEREIRRAADHDQRGEPARREAKHADATGIDAVVQWPRLEPVIEQRRDMARSSLELCEVAL